MSHAEELRDALQSIISLSDNEEPGLFTWHEAWAGAFMRARQLLACEAEQASSSVTEASMRAAPGMMQPRRLFAEQLVDAVVEVALARMYLRQKQNPHHNVGRVEASLMEDYSKAREVAVGLVIADEAGEVLSVQECGFRLGSGAMHAYVCRKPRGHEG